MNRFWVTGFVVLGLLSGELPAAEVYRSTGPYGEVLYSDVETPGAEAVTVDTPPAASGTGGDWVAETLAVAEALETSRLAREAAAAERREAYRKQQVVSAPVASEEDRRVYGPPYAYPYYWGPGYPYRPGNRPGRPSHRPAHPDRLPSGAKEPSLQAPIPWSGAEKDN